MIPKDYITEWRQTAPWVLDAQVEQDLVISRALVEIYSSPTLAKKLAFRGGTAMFKLNFPPVRYSEDIDLVQVEAAPIGEVIDALRSRLDSWLGQPKRKSGDGGVTLSYRFNSEDGIPLRLKVEINTREHFSVLGFTRIPFTVENRWFSGNAEILTFEVEELLATKLRALYQRKKGRDIFDLWYAFNRAAIAPDPEKTVRAFLHYMDQEGHHISRAMFEQNLDEKRQDISFSADIRPLLASDDDWSFDAAFTFVAGTLLPLLPGEPWQKPQKLKR